KGCGMRVAPQRGCRSPADSSPGVFHPAWVQGGLMSKHPLSGLSSRVMSVLVVAAMLGATLPSPASSRVIGTEESLNSAGADRAALNAWLARDEVRGKLVSLGVDPAEVEARVAALGDEEVVALAGNLEELP